MAKAKEKTANAENAANNVNKKRTIKGKTTGNYLPINTSIQNYIKNYNAEREQLEKNIANAQQYRGKLQELKVPGITGDSREAQENVYKFITMLKDMTESLEKATGQTFSSMEETLAFIEKEIAEKGQVITASFDEHGNMQNVSVAIDNALTGSKSIVTSTISHVQQNIIDLADEIGVSVDTIRKYIPKRQFFETYILYIYTSSK